MKYFLKRVALIIPTILVVAIITFPLVNMMEGNAALVMLGSDASPKQVAALEAQLGLDKPILERFEIWFTGLLKGDFGQSLSMRQPVLGLIAAHLSITIQLALMALVISIIIGVPAGILSAVMRTKLIEIVILIIAMLGIAMPEFWLGLNLVSIFSVSLHIFPTGGYVPLLAGFSEWLRHLLLPAFSLGFIQAALLTRMTRSAMLDVFSQDYIRTARAKGAGELVVIMKHSLRNALITIVTVVGLSLTALLSGAVVIESVFSLPGIGRLLINAVRARDLPLVQGIIIVVAMLSLIVNLIVDLTYRAINPKIRFK